MVKRKMILNFQVNHIESKIYAGLEEIRKYRNININYDINLKNPSIVIEETPFGEKTFLRIEYAFSINYLSPSIGHIRFEGLSDYYNKDENLKDLKEKWEKGNAPIEVQNEVANIMVTNLAPLAMTLSKTLGLPPALPIPAINFQQAGMKKREEPTHYHA